MPDNSDAGGLVSLTDLKQLAELFDAAENALVPDSPEAKAAQIAFDSAVQQIYDCKVAMNTQFASVAQPIFKAKLRSLCRQFLRKN